MDLSATPAAVQKAITAQAGDGTVDQIERITDQGVTSFDVEMTTKDGLGRDFTVAPDGGLKSLEISLGDAPTAVQKAVTAQVGKGKLDLLEKVMNDDGISYEATMVTADGQDRDFTVGESGKLESLEIPLTQAPAGVQKVTNTKIGEGTLENVEKNFDEGSISYQIGFSTKEGKPGSFTLDENGVIESEEVGLESTPAEVQATIAKEVGKGKVQDIDKIYDPDGITYEVGITKAGKYHNFTVAANGHLDSREVALADAPAPVQATIKTQLGESGKVLRIDRSFVGKEAGVFPYEVSAEKNGKPFDFSVGPGGKFLGMDDADGN